MTRSTTVTVLRARLLADRQRDRVLAVETRLAGTSSLLSVIRATSPSVTTDPSLYARTIFSKSFTSRRRPSVRIENSEEPEMKLPPGISVFWRAMALPI